MHVLVCWGHHHEFMGYLVAGLAEYAGLKGAGVPFTREQLLERCRETAA